MCDPINPEVPEVPPVDAVPDDTAQADSDTGNGEPPPN